MGLIDVLNGMQNGPRGQRQPSSGSSGGMSPMTMAILGLLAYKAVKSFSGGQPSPGQPTRIPPGGKAIDTSAPNSGGGLACLRRVLPAAS
jgi:hypothetical protein